MIKGQKQDIPEQPVGTDGLVHVDGIDLAQPMTEQPGAACGGQAREIARAKTTACRRMASVAGGLRRRPPPRIILEHDVGYDLFDMRYVSRVVEDKIDLKFERYMVW